jgi:DNA-directed RNA polymerase sigma subunit (sigma70/sigma32)
VFSYIQQHNWKKHVVRIGRRLRNKRLQEGGDTTIPTVSLDYRNEDGEFLEIEDGGLGIEDIIQKEHDIYFVQKFVGDIKSERNREMLKAYYGLDDEDPLNMTALSDIYKVSKQRCQQIISAEVKKIAIAYAGLDS